MGHMAEFSPLVAPDAYCSDCGQLMKKELKLDKRGRVIGVIYVCFNEETGCSYRIVQDQRLSGMQELIR